MKSVLSATLFSLLLVPCMSHEDERLLVEVARRLASKLSLDEKISLVHGVSGPYVGNVAAQPEHGIPAVNMSDGPQGFRGPPGTSTAWPCALSLAASWDVELARRWGSAMADEFKGKGSNVLLGPGLNVARVPNNGRNFEYLSGEDPVLGAKLAAAHVSAIQERGVIACAKHYVHNNQETDRGTVNEVVDEKTHWELYMPPFEASVRAGLLSVMCSYNKVNGVYACENGPTLTNDLKEMLGFKGFVVSDWGATHSDVFAANAGLDMEMPGDQFFGEKLKEAILANKLPMDVLDDKVQRVLYALVRSGAMLRPTTGSIDANVTCDEHNQLAREMAAAGTVLLKNENGLLPLSHDQCNIAVIGDIITTGGGSGHVEGPYTISGFEGIKNKCSTGTVSYSPMSNANTHAAEKADVVIVFTSTSSSEGSDRTNTSFPSTELKVIDNVISVASNVIVVGTAPGAVLLPFAEQVKGLVLTFLPGQEGGNAVADVLFGDVNPSAKLPLTMPNIENEVGFTPDQYPGTDGVATYTEKLLVGYRWYDSKRVSPKFPFGFGMSYTDFSYSSLQVHSRNVQFVLANTGTRDGSEVCQLYLSFPPTATDEPPKLLKDFTKKFLKAGESKPVVFLLSARDFSIWDTQLNKWDEVEGEFTVSVGSSSSDLPLRAQIFNKKSVDVSIYSSLRSVSQQ